MAEQSVTRRLAAILAADMVGYSRLMEVDEAGTIARQKAYRAELIDPKIAEHHGRIVKTTGDGLLVEFASVVDAVACAVATQRALVEREADVPEERRIQYRIGVNLGDIVIDDDDILGDGVNIAARLEGLAEPGGICISGTTYDQLKRKVDVGYEFLGEQQVKNIAVPVPVYRVLLDPAEAGKVIVAKRSAPTWWRWAAGSAGVLLVLVVAALVWWQPWVARVEPAAVAKMAFPLPDKPSIAVLPFNNLSSDPEQDFLADGLTENIISALSKVPEMFVIARNSTFTYKGTAVKVQQVAEEMGVRYVLEGSMQRADDQIRVTAQLVDAIKGHHLWSERYDRKFSNLFAIQDDITLRIVSALQVNLTEGDYARLDYRPTNNLQAWGNLVKGITLLRRFTKADMAKARELFERAVELDPEYVGAWTFLGWTHWNDARSGWSESREKSFEMSMDSAKEALSLTPDDSSAHALLGSLYLLQREHDKAISEGRKAIALAPSIPENYAILAVSTYYAGEFEETVSLTKQAMRLHPRYPAWYSYRIGVAHMLLGQYDEAITALKAWRDSNPSYYGRKRALAAAYSMAGQVDAARELVSEILTAEPSYSLKRYAKFHFFKNPEHLERILSALRDAGLPE